MKQINIIQFLPYYPPHIWGLEKVAQEIWKHWVDQKLGTCTQVIFDVWQEKKHDYYDYGSHVILLPSFEIIANFPVPKFWLPRFWKTLKKISRDKDTRVITHTRFFLSSLLWALFAKKHKLKWLHIEHGSDYVQLSSKFKNKLAYIYDRTLGRWILKYADQVACISQAALNFVQQEFWRKDGVLWHRWIDFPPLFHTNILLQDMFPGKIILWYIGRLYKWKNVAGLCQSYQWLSGELKSKTQLVIIGGGEEYEYLSQRYKDTNIYFTNQKSTQESFELQSQFDIHVHPSSPWWGLASTLLQAMHLWCYIIATPYEWANEVIEHKLNGVLLDDDSLEALQTGLQYGVENYDKNHSFREKNPKKIQEQFSWKTNIHNLYTLIS